MKHFQDIQYHEVKYIIDKTYECKDTLKSKIDAYRKSRSYLLYKDIKRQYALYQIYKKHMKQMYDGYMQSIKTPAMPSYIDRIDAGEQSAIAR